MQSTSCYEVCTSSHGCLLCPLLRLAAQLPEGEENSSNTRPLAAAVRAFCSGCPSALIPGFPADIMHPLPSSEASLN